MSVRRSVNGKSWRAFLKYRGHRDTKTFARKVDAERWLTEQRAAIDRGSWLDPSRGRITVGALFEQWEASRSVQGSTLRNDRNVWAAYVAPRFERTSVADVSVTAVREWLAGLTTRKGEPVAPRTR